MGDPRAKVKQKPSGRPKKKEPSWDEFVEMFNQMDPFMKALQKQDTGVFQSEDPFAIAEVFERASKEAEVEKAAAKAKPKKTSKAAKAGGK